MYLLRFTYIEKLSPYWLHSFVVQQIFSSKSSTVDDYIILTNKLWQQNRVYIIFREFSKGATRKSIVNETCVLILASDIIRVLVPSIIDWWLVTLYPKLA